MKLKFKFKGIYSLLFFAGLIINIFTTSNCFDFDNFNNIDYSEIDFDDLEELENETRELTTTLKNELQEALGNLVQKLETPLWRKTKPPKGRDTLYLIPHKMAALEYGGITANLFFNYTANMDFSPDETLKLSENKEALEKFVQALQESVLTKEASSLIPLFKKMSIQERKLGGLLQAGFTTGPFTFQINTSLQLSERNFWLSKKDQEEIKAMFAESDGKFSDAESDGKFSDKELYKIRYGLGDTRIKAGVNTLNLSSFQLDVGFEGIIPTAPKSNLPKLDSYDITLESFENSWITLLQSVRDNLINPKLGNNGHWGIGCYAESKLDILQDKVHLWNRISFDNLFPGKEDRLIPSKQTIAPPASGDLTAFVLNILRNNQQQSEFVKQYIFPPPYTVTVKPGGIVNFVSNITIDLGKKWRYGIGYDFYMQQRERFDKIHNADIQASSLYIEDAQQASAYQHKIFTEINHVTHQKGWDLHLGLGGDYTIASKGIGQDWTIFLRGGISF
jgi:hypothetical protein